MSIEVLIATEVALCIVVETSRGYGQELYSDLHEFLGTIHVKGACCCPSLTFVADKSTFYIFFAPANMTYFNRVRAWLGGKGKYIISIGHSQV